MSPSAICFLCPVCELFIRAAVPMGGLAADCPRCGRWLTVPSVTAAPEDTLEMAVDTLTLAQLRAAVAD